jgi:hypothetical protein
MTAPPEPEAIRQRLRQLRTDLEELRRERARRQTRMNLALQLNSGREPPTPRQVAELAAARAARDQVLAELAATKAEITTLTAQRKRRP